MTETRSDWSFRLAREEVPEDGLHLEIVADEAVRGALARTAGVRDVARLAATFDITRTGRDGLHVTGEVTAIVTQNCVVTLEPIEKNLLEPIDLTFVPEPVRASLTVAQGSILGDESEPPDLLEGGAVDLGAIATEYFLLGIDPYPRKAGVEFEAPHDPGAGAGGAFSALAALRKSGPGEQG
jgi:hypothetical protein